MVIAPQYNGERFRETSEVRRIRMAPRTMKMAAEIQELFRIKGDTPTSLEFVVECAIAALHRELSLL